MAAQLISTSGGRMVRSFSDFVEDCYARCGVRSTQVLDAAMYEWAHGSKSVTKVTTAVVRRPR